MAVFRWSVPGVVTGKAPQQLVVWCVPTSTRDEAGWKGAEALKRDAAVNRPPPLVAKRGPSSKHTSVAARTSDTFPPCYLMLNNFNVSCRILSNMSVTWGQTTENMLRLCNCWPPSNSSSKLGQMAQWPLMISQEANSNIKWKGFIQLRSLLPSIFINALGIRARNVHKKRPKCLEILNVYIYIYTYAKRWTTVRDVFQVNFFSPDPHSLCRSSNLSIKGFTEP